MPLTNREIPKNLREQGTRFHTRFLESCHAKTIDPAAYDLRAANTAWIISPFIGERAIADPKWFIEEILTSPVAARGDSFYRKQITSILAATQTPTRAYADLRLFRNREIARIAWRDIIAGADVLEVTAELSNFADACIAGAEQWSATQLRERFGTPLDERGETQSLVVIAMGKLGGRELNFSSDIDLIFAFPSAGDTHGGKREVSHQEFFDRQGKLLIALLNEPTPEGFVFRVDMRLRPFGDSGPLTSNFDALEHYYQLHGRDWERYALIKARTITGRVGDQEKLRGLLKPFVYRRYLDYGALEAVREMKELINAEVARKELQENVKLGAGGIREIEFIGQTLQLIRGGQEPSLQQRSIIAVLAAAGSLNLLDPQDSRALDLAYRFLRRVEHRLQQVADQQTHQLPNQTIERSRLTYAFDVDSYAEFTVDLERHREIVRRCFRELISPERTEANESSARLSGARALWLDPGCEDSAIFEIGFSDVAAVRKVVEQLKHPRFLGRLSRQGLERFDRLMPQFIESLGRRAPSAETFSRLAELLQAIARRSVYLSLLADRPVTLERLIDLYDASPWIAGQITQQPLLLDELLDPRSLYSPPGGEQLITELQGLLDRFDVADDERAMDTLRQFKNQQVLRVAASDVMEHFPVAKVSNQLSHIASALLHHAIRLASHALSTKHGVPRCVDGGRDTEVGFAVIAYGKLGGYELGYSSDLDLVFVHDGVGERQETSGPKVVANGVYFTRLVQRIIHFLETRTAAGRAYEVDTRLRPSGASGLLVSSVTAFHEYQRRDAWTWEHQALVRARAVAGSPATIAAFARTRADILCQVRDARQLRRDIVEMRERMRPELDDSNAAYFDLKQGLGGITDIEFMVQYWVLRWANEHHELLAFTDNLRLLEVLAQLGLISTNVGATLHDAYFAYRAQVHRCALQETDGLVSNRSFREQRKAVVTVWQNIFA
jgi:glutamate-ammonia-ligase adenylyltransferase